MPCKGDFNSWLNIAMIDAFLDSKSWFEKPRACGIILAVFWRAKGGVDHFEKHDLCITMPCSKSDVASMELGLHVLPAGPVGQISWAWKSWTCVLLKLQKANIARACGGNHMLASGCGFFDYMEVRENGSLMTLKAHFLPIKSITSS